jgi:hypothetical protein
MNRAMAARETVEPHKGSGGGGGNAGGGGKAAGAGPVARNESPRAPTRPAPILPGPTDVQGDRLRPIAVKPVTPVATAPPAAVVGHDGDSTSARATGLKFLPDAAVDPDLGGEERLTERYAFKTPVGMRRTDTDNDRRSRWVNKTGRSMELTVTLAKLPDSAGRRPNVVTVMPRGRRLEVPAPALVMIGGHREDGTIGDIDFVRVTKDAEVDYVAVDGEIYLHFECHATDARSMALLESAVRTLRRR